MRRTEEQIKKFLERLEIENARVGYCLRPAVTAIEKRMTIDQCYDKVDFEEWDEEQNFHAINAVSWMNGESDGTDLISEIIVHDFDVNKIANIIGVSLEEWKGNCYGIATLCVEKGAVKGKARYGQFHGKISQDGYFAGRDISQHGWVEMDKGIIFDPTRWVFENVEPYIYIGTNDNGDYDMGANRLKKAMGLRKEIPQFNSTDKKVELKTDAKTLKFIQELLGDERKSNVFTLKQMLWLSGTPPESIGGKPMGKKIYEALIGAELKGFIPIDNYEYIME